MQYTRFPCKCYHTKMYTVHVTYCMQLFTLVVGTVSHTSTFSLLDSTWRGHTHMVVTSNTTNAEAFVRTYVQ